MEVEEEFRILQGNISKHLTTGRKNIIFQEGIISPEVMKYMFGDFVEDVTRSRVTVSEMSHFIHINESVFINTLQHAGPNEVLVHGYSCRQIERIDMTGKLNKEIKLQTDCEDFILIDNDVIYSHFRDMAIRYLPSTGSVSDIYSTAPHFPVGINTSRDGNILVTLCGCSDRNITSESRGHIIQINTSGGLIRKYGYTDCHSDKVLTWPLTVAQNINLDICIIDRLDKDCRSRLVVITISSQVKFIYTGQSSLREMFVAFDVSCDHRGRILVTDLHNHAIHLLNADGHFIQYVLSNQSPLLWPTSLALDRKTLWVGCREGVIRVYNYSD
ncbi:hypothetical protein FSP39_006826 [Pinctada imbricata]|uniref:Uncharacterized protein n=1 Tax=Pinctada imbricata TaxID=66713 RepID=A0AA89CCJ6_PINIB|nr:hypothetical protein FSP39_006826 [Pinctada imbricata]